MVTELPFPSPTRDLNEAAQIGTIKDSIESAAKNFYYNCQDNINPNIARLRTYDCQNDRHKHPKSIISPKPQPYSQ